MKFHLFPKCVQYETQHSITNTKCFDISYSKTKYACEIYLLRNVDKPTSFINLLASNNGIEDYQNYRRSITVQALRNLEIKFFIAYWF